MLTTSTESAPSIAGRTSQYLPKDGLACIILIIYLETDLSEKFNLNLGYILIKVSDPDNQNDTLYKTAYQKLMVTVTPWSRDL